MEIFNPNSNINFLGWRKISITISVVLMVLSIGLILTRGLNYGLDFTGGVVVDVSYAQPISDNDVRAALEKGGFEHAVVQSISGTNEISIRLQPRSEEAAPSTGPAQKTDAATPPATDAANAPSTGADKVDNAGGDNAQKASETATKVIAVLQAARPDATRKYSGFVGPQVGEELKSDGVIAVLFVIVGIMIYIGLRFEKRFAIAAIASEFHDTIITVGFFALTQREFDITVLASVLSVVGYSINDKVVVFDRVRELFRSARKGTPEDILNKAINSTLSRTIITSLFTGVTMIALYFFGGPVMHGFALTMIIGIIIGTLSSIFFANPILLWLGVSKTDLMPVTKEDPELARRP